MVGFLLVAFAPAKTAQWLHKTRHGDHHHFIFPDLILWTITCTGKLSNHNIKCTYTIHHYIKSAAEMSPLARSSSLGVRVAAVAVLGLLVWKGQDRRSPTSPNQKVSETLEVSETSKEILVYNSMWEIPKSQSCNGIFKVIIGIFKGKCTLWSQNTEKQQTLHPPRVITKWKRKRCLVVQCLHTCESIFHYKLSVVPFSHAASSPINNTYCICS